jgi:hypothetical protein
MKLISCILGFFLCLATAATPPSSPAAPALLPHTFGGWNLSGRIRTSKDPAAADPVNAALLKEYGFQDFASAAYITDDGRKLTVKAARFEDATGAYGAFTYYKMPQMLVEKIGDQAASLNERVLFYRQNVLVDAVFSKLSAMSAAELRELASDLPSPGIDAQKLPGLPAYLPRGGYVKNSAKYVVGPVGLASIHAPVSADLVDFTSGAEFALGNYDSPGGAATLMLISYPTPQIAATRLQAIDAAHRPDANRQPDSTPLIDIGPIFTKRTGPIIVIASGPLSPSEAKSLLATVNYDANVTWNENTAFTKKDNLANLLVNIILLCGIILGLMLVAGVAFGGARILVKRFFPDRVLDRRESMEIISLHLDETRPTEVESGVTPSIKAIYGRSNGH